jgi:hypothetical protein
MASLCDAGSGFFVAARRSDRRRELQLAASGAPCNCPVSDDQAVRNREWNATHLSVITLGVGNLNQVKQVTHEGPGWLLNVENGLVQG